MTIANTPNLTNYWMPFTANRQFKKVPRLLASADSVYFIPTSTAIRYRMVPQAFGASRPAMGGNPSPRLSSGS